MSVILHVPHASVALPDDARRSIMLDDTLLDIELLASTDLHTDALVAGLDAIDPARVHLHVNAYSRLVVDPERFLDPEREATEQVGRGVVYTHGHDGRMLRDASDPAFAALRSDLIARYFAPYHAGIERLVADAVATHGQCTIVDVHSYPRQAQPYELAGGLAEGAPRPQLCIGTDRQHTPPDLLARVERAAGTVGASTARDTPFSGTFVPTPFLGDRRVRSVMLEIRRDTIVDEASGAAHAGIARMRAMLTTLVTDLIERPLT